MMRERKMPLPRPMKIWNAVSKKFSPVFTRHVDKRQDNYGPTGVNKSDIVTKDLRYV